MTAPHSIPTALKAASVALVTTALIGTGAPALAAGTHLCDGYRGCAQKGMGNGGYAAVNDRMYWRMYSGHNCTNYVAYRMIKSGLPNKRPWEGGGNATYWGGHMSRITDGTPRVGSVAWWKDGGPGHVAYVERVVSPSEIIISQDSWGGDFSWARVVKTSRWPDGFIHFNDVPLRNTGAPRFGGLAKVGNEVTAGTGAWSPRPTSMTYAWYVGDRLLPRAKQPTVRLTSWMVGKPLTLKVTASRLGYPTARLTTVATQEILPGTITAPQQPDLGGRAQVDRTLTLSRGSWAPQPVTVSHRWLVDGKPVKGATSTRLRMLPGYAGKTVTATVTARRPGYEPVTRTLSAGRVALATTRLTQRSTVSGTRLRGEQLTLRTGRTAQPGSRSIQWLRDGEPIPGATRASYTLTRRDVTHVVSARVRHTRTGYQTVTEQVGRQVVKGRVRLLTERTRVRNGFVFSVRPMVVGRTLTEPVRLVVRYRGRVMDDVVIRDGRGRVRVTGLPHGRRTLMFSLSATSLTLAKVVARRPFFR